MYRSSGVTWTMTALMVVMRRDVLTTPVLLARDNVTQVCYFR